MLYFINCHTSGTFQHKVSRYVWIILTLCLQQITTQIVHIYDLAHCLKYLSTTINEQKMKFDVASLWILELSILNVKIHVVIKVS